MSNPHDEKPNGPRIFAYRGTVPPWLALLMVAPLLFVFLSFAAVLVTGGALGALVLPLFLRRGSGARRDTHEIELDRDQYRRVDSEGPHLPRQ